MNNTIEDTITINWPDGRKEIVPRSQEKDKKTDDFLKAIKTGFYSTFGLGAAVLALGIGHHSYSANASSQNQINPQSVVSSPVSEPEIKPSPIEGLVAKEEINADIQALNKEFPTPTQLAYIHKNDLEEKLRELSNYGTTLTFHEFQTTYKQIEKYAKYIKEASKLTGVSENIIKAVIFVESRGKPEEVSNMGAQGLMQLMPDTAQIYGLSYENITDPRKNILAGTKYLKDLIETFDGDLEFALAGFNCGPSRMLLPFKKGLPLDKI